jgi:hypothetical protein
MKMLDLNNQKEMLDTIALLREMNKLLEQNKYKVNNRIHYKTTPEVQLIAKKLLQKMMSNS